MKFKNPIYVIRDRHFHRQVTYYRQNGGYSFANLSQNVSRFWDEDEAKIIMSTLIMKDNDGNVYKDYFYLDEQDGDKDIKHQYISR